MSDLTTQQLHDLMSPLWDRCEELWVEGVTFRMFVPALPDNIQTQLCESSMVRWLAKERISIEIVLSEGWDVILAPDGIGYHGDTLVHALAAACTAVLDAEEEPA